jgi:hypothetical protein
MNGEANTNAKGHLAKPLILPETYKDPDHPLNAICTKLVDEKKALWITADEAIAYREAEKFVKDLKVQAMLKGVATRSYVAGYMRALEILGVL